MTELEQVVARARGLRPRTRSLYRQHIRTFIEFAGATPESWTSEVTSRWCANMQERCMSPQSINVALNAVRFAARRLPNNFADAVKTLPLLRKNHKERILTWEEGQKLLAACNIDESPRDLRDTAIVTLGLRTGMLRFSICKIDFSGLNLPMREGSELSFEKKGGQLHTIKLDKVTVAALSLWIQWLSSQGITSGPVFRSIGREHGPRTDHKGRTLLKIGDKALTPDGLYRVLRERASIAGIPDIQPQVFRKTFLAWASAAGAKPEQIAIVTGHIPIHTRVVKSSRSESKETQYKTTSSKLLPANFLLKSWRLKNSRV